MKKILSAIVVAALGWVAFDRATLGFELRDRAYILDAEARKAASKASSTAAPARNAYAREALVVAARARDADAAARNAYARAAGYAALAAAIAVVIYLSRKTPSA